jgi:putative chitinase
LNELADVQDFITITERINGGTTGLKERQRYYETAMNALGVEELG